MRLVRFLSRYSKRIIHWLVLCQSAFWWSHLELWTYVTHPCLNWFCCRHTDSIQIATYPPTHAAKLCRPWFYQAALYHVTSRSVSTVRFQAGYRASGQLPWKKANGPSSCQRVTQKYSHREASVAAWIRVPPKQANSADQPHFFQLGLRALAWYYQRRWLHCSHLSAEFWTSEAQCPTARGILQAHHSFPRYLINWWFWINREEERFNQWPLVDE